MCLFGLRFSVCKIYCSGTWLSRLHVYSESVTLVTCPPAVVLVLDLSDNTPTQTCTLCTRAWYVCTQRDMTRNTHWLDILAACIQFHYYTHTHTHSGKKITKCCLSQSSGHFFIGTESGNVFILDVKHFQLTSEVIYWNQATALWAITISNCPRVPLILIIAHPVHCCSRLYSCTWECVCFGMNIKGWLGACVFTKRSSSM